MASLASSKIISALALAGVLSISITSAFVQVQRPFASPRSMATKAYSASALNAVSKKDSYAVTLLPGDGIGPEITAATKEVIAAVCERFGFKMELKEALIGGAAIDAVNDPFPQESLDQCRASDSVLLACIGGYKWDTNPRELRPESGLLKMRKEMGLFANLRPAKALPQLIDASSLKREIVEGVDIMVVRELTGDVYFGTPKGIDIIDGMYSCTDLYCMKLYSTNIKGHASCVTWCSNSPSPFLTFVSIIFSLSYSRPACGIQQHDLLGIGD